LQRRFIPELDKSYTAPRTEGTRGGVSSPQNYVRNWRSVGKIARRKFFGSESAVFFIENFDSAAVDAAVPFRITDGVTFVTIPKRAVREPVAFEIPSVPRLTRADLIFIQFHWRSHNLTTFADGRSLIGENDNGERKEGGFL